MIANLKQSAEESASIQRLLASETISRAPRVKTVLQFLLDSQFEGRLEQINEQTIGELVFGRPRGYNPSDDNIVRVTIRHLRDRLEKFYEAEGRDEPWIVEIPKGKYVPVIRPRTLPIAIVEPAREPSPAPLLHQPQGSKRLIWLLASALVLVTIALVYSLAVNSRVAANRARSSGLLQDLFFAAGQRASVVLADSNLQAYRLIFGKTVPLNTYLDRSYLRPTDTDQNFVKGAWGFVSGRKDTSISSVIVAARIQNAVSPRFVDLRHPRDLSTRDFEHESLILLGGPWINPWGQLFEGGLNFRVVTPQANASGSQIRNMNPLPGEPQLFATRREGSFTLSYVRIAYLPNLAHTGHVLLVGANTDEALEAGGAFLLSSEGLAELLRRFHVRRATDLPPFELVFEVKGIELTPETIHIVAQRTIGTGP